MANKVIFSGESKHIIVKSGVTEIDVQVDLYSDWKEWVVESDNSKYLQAFRTFGGDPTITGQFAPRYFFFRFIFLYNCITFLLFIIFSINPYRITSSASEYMLFRFGFRI